MLEISSLFDESFYINQNPDVAEAIITATISSAYDHFLTRGQFERRNPLLARRMDLSKVGMIGHSFGGVTKTAMMQLYPRLQAEISLNRPILSPVFAQGIISKSFMQLSKV